jgi:hypothetical protein
VSAQGALGGVGGDGRGVAEGWPDDPLGKFAMVDVAGESRLLPGFCASSSAKAVMVGWSHAAWRSWIFLCSLRSFILR